MATRASSARPISAPRATLAPPSRSWPPRAKRAAKCVQALHVEPYGEEPAALERMRQFAAAQGVTIRPPIPAARRPNACAQSSASL